MPNASFLKNGLNEPRHALNHGRLGEELFHAIARRLSLHFFGRVRCDGRDVGLRGELTFLIFLLDETRCFEAVHLRHANVHEDDFDGRTGSLTLLDLLNS